MAASFTVYCRFDKGNRFQKSNFRRWNRRLQKDHEAFEVIVFHDDPDIKRVSEKFQNLRFWRLHNDMSLSQTGLLNEAIRYARTDILVYVAPDVLARKADLYRLANLVRQDYSFAWLNLRYGFDHENKNILESLRNRVQWFFRLGRFELYARLNSPFNFFRASLFSIRKKNIDNVFSGLSMAQKEKLIRCDNARASSLNYYFFHLILKNKLKRINGGKAASYDFIYEKPSLFYSYKNTCSLIGQMIRRESFHYPVSYYRFLFPVLQLTQIFFLVFVFFSPWKSLNLAVFYLILAMGLFTKMFSRDRHFSPFLVLVWFFSWLFA